MNLRDIVGLQRDVIVPAIREYLEHSTALLKFVGPFTPARPYTAAELKAQEKARKAEARKRARLETAIQKLEAKFGLTRECSCGEDY